MISNPSLMAHESESEYDKLVSGLIAAHQPRNEFERLVVENLAVANWELRRVRATDSEYWEHLGGCYNRGTAGVAEALLQEKETRFRALFKMRALVQRQYEKAMDELYRMLDLRDRSAQQEIPAGQTEPAQTARRRKLKTAAAGDSFESNTAAPVIAFKPRAQGPSSTG
jgi:hypothetical protein